MKNIMIDIETLGTDPGSVILSVGAVSFTWAGGYKEYSTFYQLADPDQHRRVGLDTIRWWIGKDPAELSRLLGSETCRPLGRVLQKLSEWLPDREDYKIWANGPTFDISILENAYVQYGMKVHWPYYAVCDYRTIRNLFDPENLCYSGENENPHNALSDARYQAQRLAAILDRYIP